MLCVVAFAIVVAIPASAETGSEVIYDSKDGVATVSGSQAKKTTGGSMVYSAEPYCPLPAKIDRKKVKKTE